MQRRGNKTSGLIPAGRAGPGGDPAKQLLPSGLPELFWPVHVLIAQLPRVCSGWKVGVALFWQWLVVFWAEVVINPCSLHRAVRGTSHTAPGSWRRKGSWTWLFSVMESALGKKVQLW